MSRPEGYRKALRLMRLAEKFKLPLFTFVDTPGAYPGVGAEERGQSEAIGHNIFEMARLEVPIIVTIIGEGGSGGALALSVGDQLLMLQYSVYSVISPEGWRIDPVEIDRARRRGRRGTGHHRAPPEGAGPGRQDRQRAGRRCAPRPKAMSASLKRALGDALRQVVDLKPKELLDRRYQRLQSYGRFGDTKAR